MTTFPRSPKLTKGAIIGIDIFNPLASVIVFQYNPITMRRELTARFSGGETSLGEVTRLGGEPQEMISLDVEFDATDQLEKGDGIATSMGIGPQLAALEMLIYPKSVYIIAKTALSLAGVLEMDPPRAPMTLFVWGVKRVLPVQLSGFTIEEQAYDVNLNPIRAKVSLRLRVLGYSDFDNVDPGYYLFMAHHVVKEVMATIGSVNNISAVGSGSIDLL